MITVVKIAWRIVCILALVPVAVSMGQDLYQLCWDVFKYIKYDRKK